MGQSSLRPLDFLRRNRAGIVATQWDSTAAAAYQRDASAVRVRDSQGSIVANGRPTKTRAISARCRTSFKA
jgi:hypothetical protein